MTAGRFLIRSILYYWRTNLAVLLGVVAATAVIGGALIVGDSVRGSLRQMTLDRLGQIDHAFESHRFFREELADELTRRPGFADRFSAAAPAVVMQGGVERTIGPTAHSENGNARTTRAGGVSIYGVDERLWNLTDHPEVPVPGEGDVILNRRVAVQLEAGIGDRVTLWIEIPASVPRDTLLGGGNEQRTREMTLTVRDVLDESSGAGRLALNPTQQLPLNVFVSLDSLQAALNLAPVRPSRRHPAGASARVNSLFVSAKSPPDAIGEQAADASRALSRLLAQAMTLEDLGLAIRQNSARGYLSLESRQMVLEPAFAEAGQAAASRLEQLQSPVDVYLANEISNPADPDAYSMYSIIAGLDFEDCQTSPFGPFQSLSSSGSANETVADPPGSPIALSSLRSMAADEIVLNEWLAHDLHAVRGSKVRVKYYLVGPHGDLSEQVRTFTVRDIVALAGSVADDRGLTPHAEGITDAGNMREWKQPFEMDLDRITQRDEEYWENYRATPKAFIDLATAQELWQTRYGQLTSLRVGKVPGKSLSDSAADFESAFLTSLDLRKMDLSFQPVKFDGLAAASGTTDFTGLFIGFSFFLILSATILIGLLFRLGLERRGPAIGLLSALGFSPRGVGWVFLAEGLLVVSVGALLGLVAAVAYASLMVYGLKTWWIGAIGTRFLEVSVKPMSLVLGLAIACFVAVAAVVWALRGMRALSPRELLAGSVERWLTAEGQRRRGRRASRIALVSAILAGLLLAGAITRLIPTSEAFFGLSWQVIAFFIVGIAFLVTSVSLLAAWLDSDRSMAVRGSGMAGIVRLGTRNAARHRLRSVLSMALVASATFVIAAVAAGHRNPGVESPDRNSGNGGFLLVAETSTPILKDLNTEDGRGKLGITARVSAGDNSLLDEMLAMPFRVKPGENASCLNLYQTRLPTILGAPTQMIERGGFRFVNAGTDNPWRLLTEEPDQDPIPVIPVLGDMNTLMYSLHKAVGDTIAVPDEEHPEYRLRIAGMFDGSVFQGVLLMSEQNFQQLYPEQIGYRYFLIGHRQHETGQRRPPREEARRFSDVLETQLSAYGFDAEPVADRLANFLAVQNTYLSTFQTLGGLGLLLGSFGLATVMLRNILERRSELALMRAVGFRSTSLALVVLWENAFLLVCGLAAGTVSALLAMLPHILSIGAEVPWASGALILGGVFAVGMAAASLAVAEAVRTPIITTLRSE